MADPTFDSQLADALRGYAEAGVRPIDRMAIASAMIDGGRIERPRPWSWPASQRWLLPIAVGLLLVVLAGTVLLAGGPKPFPAVVPPGPSSDARASAAPPSAQGPVNGPIFVTSLDDPGATLHVLTADGTERAAHHLLDPWHCPHVLPGGDKFAYWTLGTLNVTAVGDGEATIVARTTLADGANGAEWTGETWSQDGRYVAVVDDGLRIIDAVERRSRKIAVDGPVVGMAWSPAGSLTVATLAPGEVRLNDITTDGIAGATTIRVPWAALVSEPFVFGWSPDGSHLAYLEPVAPDRGLVLVDARTGDRTTIATDDNLFFDPATAFAPDSAHIAFSDRTNAYVTSIDGTGHMTIPVGGTSSGPATPIWSPNGQWIATQADDLTITKADGAVVMHTERPFGRPGFWIWAPDSSMLAYRATGFEKAQVIIFRPDASPRTMIAELGSTGGGRDCLEWPAATVPQRPATVP